MTSPKLCDSVPSYEASRKSISYNAALSVVFCVNKDIIVCNVTFVCPFTLSDCLAV